MSREDRLKYLLTMQEMERRKRSAPLFYYKPHEGQQAFHDAVKTHRIVILHSGNRFGKSHASAAETIAWIYGYRVWEVPDLKLTSEGDYPARTEIPPEYWVRTVNDVPVILPTRFFCISGLGARQGISTVMWPKIESMLPPAVLRHPDFSITRAAGIPIQVRFPRELSTGGAEMIFGSGDQEVKQYEGGDFTAVGIDEPPKRAFWPPIWRGLTDRHGSIWFTCTPTGPNAPWLYEEFIAKDREDVSVKAIAGSIHQNPHISKQSKKEFLDGGGFSEEERGARESGKWQFLSHLAFPMFDPDVHVVPSCSPPSGWVRGLAIDPAHRRPFMMVWAAFGPDGEVLIYREYPDGDHSKMRTSLLTVPDYIREIHSRELGERIDFRCLDPRFGAAHPRIKGEVHTSIQDDFASHGMYFDCRLEGTEREEIGIERVRQLLRWDRKSGLSVLNRPKLRVMRKCPNVISALSLSNFAPPGTRDPDILPEKLLERHKDARDCVRYLVLYPFMPYNSNPDELSYISPRELEEENSEDWWPH